MRIILFTGKGGVGKTTVAAATAIKAAEQGHRTVVLSTDSAHSLADSFDLPLGVEPTLIRERLWGQETDVYYNIEKYWGVVQEWLRSLLAWRGVDELMADEVAVLPGMEELANLLWINQHYESGEYDVIIVDCAPTGETLKLLSFPEAASWWVDKLLPIHRRITGTLRPFMRPFTDMPLPTSEVYDSSEELFQHLAKLHSLLSNPEVASVRLVLNPEKMVVKEAQRTFTYLNLYGYLTDAVVCNRLLPQQADEGYFDIWKQSQEQYLQLVQECFSPLPLLTVPFMPDEVVGLERLRHLADVMYVSHDPAAILFNGPAQTITQENGDFVLTLAIPFLEKEDISLVRTGEELVITTPDYKRNVLLPRHMRDMEVQSANFQAGRLRVVFPAGPGKKDTRA